MDGSSGSGLVRSGIVAGYGAAALSATAFVLNLLSPPDGAGRAQDALWITSALLGWVATLLAVVFLVGLLVAGSTRTTAATAAGVVALVATAAATFPSLRVLVDGAAYDIDQQFAERLSSTQTPLATAVFAIVAVLGVLGWSAVALLVAPAAGLRRGELVAVAVVGLGLLAPVVPLMAIALVVAARALARAGQHRAATRSGAPAGA